MKMALKDMFSLLSLGLLLFILPLQAQELKFKPSSDSDYEFKVDSHGDLSVERVGLTVGAIVGIVIGAVVFVILCCVCICRCCCGCCQRDRTFVQTTVIAAPQQPASQTFINMGQPAYPNAPPPNQPYPYIPPPNQFPLSPARAQGYSPLTNEPPPQYLAKE